ncbi:ATP synthase F1 subunit gamma [Flavobacteriales bacterium]|jgi:F-type H+-transporting ATPase subunit gamma|nr:ATP synthase F1 subunit gamma [Flavobacteriales bacterium]
MANLKEIRERITSVNSTMQITSAMKMVSAAKLKRAQDAITQMRPYAEKLQEILVNLNSSLEGENDGVYGTQREVKNVLIVAVTSNRGLCGGFNNNVIKHINTLIAGTYAGKNVSVMGIGKKASDFFSNQGLNVIRKDELHNDLSFDNSAKIAEDIMESFVDESFDEVIVVYNKFKNAAVQIVTTEQFLPVEAVEGESTSSTEYIYEPSKEFIVSELIPKSLKTQLYKGILDSVASEHGARMTAMHAATDNAGELKNDLKLTYNKARQAAITTEILEIVAGAEALNG